MEKTLNITPVAPAQVFDHLGRVTLPKSDTTGGAESIAEMCRNAHTFAITDGAATVGAYALRIVEHDRARVAWVTAAQGDVLGVDLIASVVPVVEAQARHLGAGQMAINTRRRGLIKKMQRLGFEITGVTLRKKL